MEKSTNSKEAKALSDRISLADDGFAARAREIIESDVNGAYKRFRYLIGKILDAPYSVMTLASKDSAVLRVAMGDEILEISRKDSFCGYAIDTSEMLIVQNAIEDPRFNSNPMVSESMHIRFYAGVPLIGSDGVVFGTICVMDTKRREYAENCIQIHQTLARMVVDSVESEMHAAELTHRLRDKESAIQSIARDLRGPIASLSVLSGELRVRAKRSNEDGWDNLSSMLARGVEAASRVVEDLDGDSDAVRCSVTEEASKILSLFGAEAKLKGVKLTLKMGESIDVRVDRAVLSTLLRKTVFNAINHCLRNGSVTIEAWKTARYVLISISDTGVGMSPEKLQAALQGDVSDSVSGLGMCRRLMEANNGHLDIISEQGMGTTVSLSFQR